MTDAINRTLYQKVADDLRAQIASGALRVGDQIPSTAELGLQHDVSATAVRNAVALLRKEGLLEGIPGKGVFVGATPADVEGHRISLQGVQDEVVELREEVHRLADQQPSEVIAKIEELKTEVGRLQADLRTLYDRLGQPYPRSRKDSKPRRHTSGA